MRRFLPLLLILIVHVAFVSGCGTIHFDGLAVVERPDGVEVQNVTSDFSVRVHKIGGTIRQGWSPMISPGDPTTWVADTKNFENRYVNITIVVSAYRHEVFVGEARREYSVPPNRAMNGFWPVHDSDLHFRSADHDCP